MYQLRPPRRPTARLPPQPLPYQLPNLQTDSTPPLITLQGSNPATLDLGSTYIDVGATATDDSGQTIMPDLVENDVNTSLVGTYHVTYTAHDAAMNIATSTRTVIVGNPTIPASDTQDTQTVSDFSATDITTPVSGEASTTTSAEI